MPFVKQEPDSNSCGAVCMCYLQWLNEGRRPTDPLPEEKAKEDYDQIHRLYADVRFGDAKPDLPQPFDVPEDYCDPVKMMRHLRDGHTAASFCISKDSEVNAILAAMRADGAPEKEEIDQMESDGLLQHTAPEIPKMGEASIAIYYVGDPKAGMMLGMHYILFRRDETGSLFRYNPWYGTAEGCHGYECFPSEDPFFFPTGAAILIKKGE